MAAVLFIVADAAALTTGETAVQTALTNQGHTVTLISDETAEASSAGYACAVTSQAASSTTIADKYSGWTKGVVVMTQNLTARAAWGMQTTNPTATTGTQWHFPGTADDALDLGLSGAQTVFPGAQGFYQEGGANLGAGAITVCCHSSALTNPVVYAYESGAAMFSGNAPARRVAFPVADSGFASLNTLGLDLFEAAVTWAINAAGGASAFPAHYYQQMRR